MKWTVIYVCKSQSQMSKCHCSEYPNVHVPLRFQGMRCHCAIVLGSLVSTWHYSAITDVGVILLWDTKCEMHVSLTIEPVLQSQNDTPVLKLHTSLDHFSCSESFSQFHWQVLEPSWGSHTHTHLGAHTPKKQAADHSEQSMRMQGGEKRERWDHGDGMERTRQGHSRDLLTAESGTWCCTWKRK